MNCAHQMMFVAGETSERSLMIFPSAGPQGLHQNPDKRATNLARVQGGIEEEA